MPRSNLGYAVTAFTWGGGRLADAWPTPPDADAYSRVRTSQVETLLIGGEVDFSTPPQIATRELLPYLPNGHQVVVPGFGHTLTFYAEQPAAGSRLINTFFASGRVDDSLYRPQPVDFTPGNHADSVRQGHRRHDDRLRAAHRALAAVDGSLGVHARTLRPQGGATLRSLSPIVLGLGGWCLGVVIVITTMPGVPLDDALFVALCVGAPVGLGIDLAWVNRDWASRTKAIGIRGVGCRRPGGRVAGVPRDERTLSHPLQRSSGRLSARTWSSLPRHHLGAAGTGAYRRRRHGRRGEPRPLAGPKRWSRAPRALWAEPARRARPWAAARPGGDGHVAGDAGRRPQGADELQGFAAQQASHRAAPPWSAYRTAEVGHGGRELALVPHRLRPPAAQEHLEGRRAFREPADSTFLRRTGRARASPAWR